MTELRTTDNHTATLPVMEVFYTLQGEGFHQGKAASFLRFAGCDIGCFWCDVPESWETDKHDYRTEDQIVQELKDLNTTTKLLVITGGEPCMHDLTSICSRLKREEFQLHLETSGAYPITGTWEWICLSPKKFKSPSKEAYDRADELKVIVYNKNDFKWAEEQAQHVSKDCKLYLQPEWSVAQKMLPQIIEYIKNNPQWTISLQTHKYLDIP